MISPMQRKTQYLLQTHVASLSTLCVMLGLALLIFNPNHNDPTGKRPDYQPAPTHTPIYNPTATPPTQSGNGANIFWVYCMPCHGDRGQGLTAEFRNRQYPPEDVNCWESGCHGTRPYEQGFTLPKTVPMLIGTGALARFQSAQALYGFIRTAMPFNKPGSLTDTQYLDLTAYLLESNHLVPQGVQLSSSTLAAITVHGDSTPPDQSTPLDEDKSGLLIGLIIFVGVATVLSIVTRPRRKKSGD